MHSIESAAAARRMPGKVLAWLVLVAALALLAYAGRLGDADVPDDLAYRYVSSIAALLQYAIIFVILLVVARGLPAREAFGLRRPASWPRAVGLAALCLLAIYLAAAVYQGALSLVGDWDPTEEQGLVPNEWDPSRAGAFVAFFLVVTFVAPAVEELTYRGLGLSLLLPYGTVGAILLTGLLFGAAHGLLVAFPILAFFGLVVGWLRVRTDSVYPPVILHSAFNGTALIVSVTVAG